MRSSRLSFAVQVESSKNWLASEGTFGNDELALAGFVKLVVYAASHASVSFAANTLYMSSLPSRVYIVIIEFSSKNVRLR